MLRFLLGLAIIGLVYADTGNSSLLAEEGENEPTEKRFQVIHNQWDHVKTPYTIAIWILIASGARIFFVLSKPCTRFLPDSSLLIVVGLGLGALLKYGGASVDVYTLTSHAFFIYLLPPIIFDAGYFMPNRALFENIDSVMLFAVAGTIWNCAAIGLSLYALSLWNWFTVSFSLLDILLFSSLISAVDPVAVIAIFEEINVNAFLFVNVFGEALFNDGVTVVLYNLFNSFQALGAENLITRDYLAGGLSFFVVAIGGIIVGVVFAFLASFVTKYSEELRAMATVFVFVVPYVSYLTAEWWAVSSIIAIAVCGMVMKQYVKGNLSQAANSSVKYFTKVLAQSSETVIFVFLGLSLLSSAFYWDTWFVVATLVFCLIYRTIGVVVQCAFLNRFRAKKFTAVDQFILSYGGLRGAIAYGLAVSMPEIKAKDMFVTTTIAVIYFTVFLQGSTVRPLVKLFKIKTEEHRMPTMAESVYNKYLDYMMSGVEDIIGRKGHYTINENYERFNAKVLKPLLMRNQKKSDFDATKILRAYAKITLEEAMTMSQAKPTAKVYPDKRIEHLKRQDASMPRLAVPSFKFEPTPQQKISQANMDQLYSMFSDLLDHKLRELQVVSRSSSVHGDHDEIEDDYMKQIAHSNQGSRANLSQMANLSTDLEAQISRRRSTGNVFDLARKD